MFRVQNEKFVRGKIYVRGDVFVVQERYAPDVVAHFNMEGCKSVSTPLDLGCYLNTSQQTITDEEKAEMIDVPYRSAIGNLMYLATCTWPDLEVKSEPGSRTLGGGQACAVTCEWDCR